MAGGYRNRNARAGCFVWLKEKARDQGGPSWSELAQVRQLRSVPQHCGHFMQEFEISLRTSAERYAGN